MIVTRFSTFSVDSNGEPSQGVRDIRMPCNKSR